MINVTIANKKFTSVMPSHIKPRFGKSVTQGNLHYPFPSTLKGSYPIELLFALISGFSDYSVVFIENDDKETWAGIFPGTKTKSIEIPNETFLLHVMRLKEVSLKPICILNNAEIAEKIEDFESLSLFALQKLPNLPDPEKNTKIIIRASLAMLASFIVLGGFSFYKAQLENQKLETMNQKNTLMSNLATVMMQNKRNPIPSLNQESQIFAKVSNQERFNGITNGAKNEN